MNSHQFSAGRRLHSVRLALLGAGFAALVPATAPAQGDNWMELSVGAAGVDGNQASFMRRHQNNGDFYGGIESFHFEQIGEEGTFTLDGHALLGLEDYEIDLSYTLDEVGFVRAGFRQFRTWYDGSGGYLPGTTTPPGWIDPITPFDDELHLDRGSLWFEAGLRMEDLPQITFGYEHLWRDGMKDSTMWQRPEEAAPNSVRPGYYRIDEVSDIFRLDVTHTLGNTDLGGGLRYHSVRNDDTRYVSRSGPTQQLDSYEYDLYSAHLYSQTRLADEKILLNFGYDITTLNSDIGGFRTVDRAYTNLIGGGQSVTQTLNGSMWWNPFDDLVIVPSFRAEWREQSAWGGRLDLFGPILNSSDYESNEQSLACEARYTGVENILLYARAEYSAENGDMYRNTANSGILGLDGFRATDSDLDRQKYVVGANWYPASGLSVAAQYFYQSYDQGFSHLIPPLLPSGPNGDDAQLYSHAATTNDANIRVTWRALPNLTFVTRYDYQQTEIDNSAFPNLPNSIAPPTPRVQSGDITKHILSENVTWSPLDQLYLQLGLHWISSETETPASTVLPAALSDWDNDYWSVSLNAGYAIGEDTEIHAAYYYYHADNYSAVAMPYGTIADEHVFTIGLNQRINESIIWNLRYGYYLGDDAAAGGFNDYEAHVVSTSIRFSF